MKDIKNTYNKPHLIILLLVFLACTGSQCHKKDKEIAPPETGSVTDVDGNIYKTIKIGSQWWMAEDLRVEHFSDGTDIAGVNGTLSNYPDTNKWAIPGNTQARFYEQDNTNFHLYNWYAVSGTHNIAPAGWRVPTDEDWKQLEMQLGMSQADADNVNWRGANEGEKLKIEGSQGWNTFLNVWPTNESGFTARAAGCVMFDGKLGDPGIRATGFWWSSTSHAGNKAWYRHLDYKSAKTFRYYGPLSYGFSIRLVAI